MMGLFSSRDVLDVSLFGIGDVAEDRFEVVRQAIETHFHADVDVGGCYDPDESFRVEPDEPEPRSARERAYDETRDQWDAETLVTTFWHPDLDTVVLLTEVDLYLAEQHRNYVFGIAWVDERRSVVSTARLARDGWSDTATARLRKQAIKQLGRSLGAERCLQSGCLMEQADVPTDLDEVEESLCSDCRRAIGESHLR